MEFCPDQREDELSDGIVRVVRALTPLIPSEQSIESTLVTMAPFARREGLRFWILGRNQVSKRTWPFRVGLAAVSHKDLGLLAPSFGCVKYPEGVFFAFWFDARHVRKQT